MNSPARFAALSLCSAFLATAFSPVALAADAAPQRVTFDGQIRNNSLALSPDEKTVVVSYSERSEVVVYDAVTGAVRGVLQGYVTPRNIVFAPDGQAFYVSDSSRGEVVKVDATTLQTVSRLAAGPGAFGTTLSRDGSALYVNNQASSTVTRFDTGREQARAVVTGLAQPRQAIEFSRDGKLAYVLNEGLSVAKVDRASQQIVQHLLAPAKP
jgi:DNA-binding beta-propeller fold protein YncE